MLVISQAQAANQIAAVRDLFQEYGAWYAHAQPEDFAQALTFQSLENELATLPGPYVPPAGRLLLATWAGQPAGCVAFKRLDPLTAEVKRLYVRPAFRGRQVGHQLVNRLVDAARQSGYTRLVLDTHISMQQAQGLYAAVGFRRVSAPPAFPEEQRSSIVFMECDLEATHDE